MVVEAHGNGNLTCGTASANSEGGVGVWLAQRWGWGSDAARPQHESIIGLVVGIALLATFAAIAILHVYARRWYFSGRESRRKTSKRAGRVIRDRVAGWVRPLASHRSSARRHGWRSFFDETSNKGAGAELTRTSRLPGVN